MYYINGLKINQMAIKYVYIGTARLFQTIGIIGLKI
jgi:hypothetical protein